MSQCSFMLLGSAQPSTSTALWPRPLSRRESSLGDGPTLPPKVEAELIELRRQAKEVPPLREEVARLQRRLTAAQKRGGRRGRATTAGS